MKKLLMMSAVFVAVGLLNACGGGEVVKTAATPTPAPSNNLVITGSTTLLPVAQKAVEDFQKRHSEIKITLHGGGSLAGINALVHGVADVAMSSRHLKKEEKEELRVKKTVTKETIIAWDGIIPIVHPANPVKDLTMAQLKDIFTGKISDWEQVGGKKGKIVVVSRDSTSGTYEAWAELVLNNEPVLESAQEKYTSDAVLGVVAEIPNAIGYDGIGYVEGNKQVKAVSVDGKVASGTTILDKSYKIARPLYLFTLESPTSAVVEFLNFMTSPEGQALVKNAKYVPVSHQDGQAK